tara:strand:- start:18 stop:458 length:441 start_codon:yes stop_codon:yes gene_type:complete
MKDTKESLWEYWLIRNNSDQPIELVRSNPRGNVVIVGEDRGITQHKRSHYFTKENKPDLDKPVTFDLIHLGHASAPVIGKAIDLVDTAVLLKQQRNKRRKHYVAKEAKQQVLALLGGGSSIREASRLCGVPRATVSDWRASQVSDN